MTTASTTGEGRGLDRQSGLQQPQLTYPRTWASSGGHQPQQLALLYKTKVNTRKPIPFQAIRGNGT